MRTVDVKEIEEAVASLFIKANKEMPCDLLSCVQCGEKNETEELPKKIMGALLENADTAKELDIPICQDTGMAVLFVELGQEVQLVGGDFEAAVNRGVAKGYTEGLLRKSVVSDPLRRVNTNDNTPAVIHLRIVPGDKIKLTAAPKGFGSENMSQLKMMTPSVSKEDIMDWILQVVKDSGGNPCPPMVLGIGIGGDFESCAYLAKKALCRAVSKRNEDPFYAEMEAELLKRVNETNIGPQGFGGKTTALAVNIEAAPTHIAGLPVAVNVGCHVTRHASCVL